MPGTFAAVIVNLCGGFGAARFLGGLRVALGGLSGLACIVNTGDDVEYLSLHVSPDLDTVCYALAGCFDEDRGWGLQGDTFACADQLVRHGQGWFRIGDKDLAVNLKRTAMMREGATLSEATRAVVDAFGIEAQLTPMCDDPVRTMIDTSDAGLLGFQDYLVARRAQPTVTGVEYAGAATAKPAPAVLGMLAEAELVIVAPSNPVSSIGPILALAGVRDALMNRAGKAVAVTPVVRGREPQTGPERVRAKVRSAFMAARGLEHRATAVARLYADFLDGFVLDAHDASEEEQIERVGIPVLVADTLATPSDRAKLAEHVLEFAGKLR